jgi:ppGpp synthetase/RelA/SpoT-type nucleotidyltranferase
VSPLGPRAQGFHQNYSKQYPDWQRAAGAAEAFFRELLASARLDVHVVSARAKSPSSVLEKIRRKKYGDPYRQLTDRIGVRLITYYREDVDQVVTLIRPQLTVNESLSEDKRTVLGLEKFGYRSVHLVAKIDPALLPLAARPLLEGKWIEIQIRSLLEHAWAAIDHEIIYKSAVQHDDEVLRQFAAMAGALEVLDSQFTQLRQKRDELIARHLTAYEQGDEYDAALDVARLLAFLEVLFPNGQSWRGAYAAGDPFSPGTDVACLEALTAIKVVSGQGLVDLFGVADVVAAIETTAFREGIAVDEVTHLARIVLAVGAIEPGTLASDFPDLAQQLLVV